jgi:hypothetical protein
MNKFGKTINMDSTVIIKRYIGTINERGVVRGFDPANKKYWVTNMNMPFQGTVSNWFSEDELTEVKW